MPSSASRFLSTYRWQLFSGLAAGLTLILALWVFSEMIDDTPKGEFVGWDEPLLRLIRGTENAAQGSRVLTALARGITAFGSTVFLTTLAVVALAWLAKLRAWRAALVFSVTALGAPLATEALKSYFVRLRPSAVTHLVDETSWSFPSGHALSSAAIYIALSVLVARRTTTRWSQVALVAGAFLLSFLIGLSRIYLGVHYPTDVLAGWSAGTAWAILCSAALLFWEYRTPPRVTRAA